jgi:hypothetical protein
MRDALVRARARGARVLQMNGERVEYKSDAEMAAAIGDLDRRIGTPAASIRTVRFTTSKGV